MSVNENIYYSCAIVSTSTGSLDYIPNRDPNIFILRLSIYLHDKTYLDGKNLTAHDFYHWMLKNPNSVPKTSPPDVGDIIDFFMDLYKKGYREALVITISSAMSETHNNIKEAALLLGNKIKIHLFDSGTSAIAEGMMAQKAAEWLRSGASIDTVLKKLNQLRNESISIVFTRTLRYLVKNKKVSMISGLLGDWLNIHPILQFENGKTHLQDKARNTSRALDKIIQHMQTHRDLLAQSEIYILYCGNEDIYDALRNKISLHLNEEPLAFPLSPVVGAYSGPDAVGVAILPKISDNKIESTTAEFNSEILLNEYDAEHSTDTIENEDKRE